MTVINRNQFTPTPEANAKARRMALNPGLGTHGTIMGDSLPEVILPSQRAGVGSHHSLSDPSKAYYNAEADDSPRYAEDEGWKWAREASYSASSKDWDAPAPRPVVHNVVPQGRVEPDTNLDFTSAMTADSLQVTDTQWIHPHSRGMQGTLPHENWNKYGSGPEQRNWHVYGDDPSQPSMNRIQARKQQAAEPHAPLRRQELEGQLDIDGNQTGAPWYREPRL